MEMNINWSVRDAKVLPELMAFPEELENKPLSISEFRNHFKNFYGHSIHDIVDAIGHYEQDGYLNADIMLNAEYLKQGLALAEVWKKLQPETKGKPDEYHGLSRRLYAKVITAQPLNKAEVLNLSDKAKNYLEIKISSIDRQRVRLELAIDGASIHPGRLVKNTPAKPAEKTVNKLPSSLKVNIGSYDPVNKILNLGKPIAILVQKRTKKSDKETQECRLMRMLFKNVKTLKRGLNMTTFTPVSNGVLGINDKKRISNYVTQINKKIKAVTGVENLIYCDDNKVKVDKSYL
jgi:hypothetical protein